MALKRRCPESGLLHHSDRGSPYASADYQTILKAHGITCSMSRRGNCYDNAVMEAFFSSVKAELRERFDSRDEAKRELFKYIEVFYNQRRRHSTIGYRSPAAYERQARSSSAIDSTVAMRQSENCSSTSTSSITGGAGTSTIGDVSPAVYEQRAVSSDLSPR
jgi:hypothetical protein